MAPPSTRPSLGLLLALALALAPAAGCDADADLALRPLRGAVSYNGRPLAGAELTFHPRSEGPGWLPVAVTGPDGRFEAGTRLPGDGAPPGRYAVSVRFRPSADGADDAPNLLPDAFADPGRSGLEVEVADGPGPSPDHAIDLAGPPLRGTTR